MSQSLKARIAAREQLVGTFIKTPSPMLCEVLARTSLDALCIDSEHSPFDRLVQDQWLNPGILEIELTHTNLLQVVDQPGPRHR